MIRKIVPRGFESSSHDCFFTYESPITVVRDVSSLYLHDGEGILTDREEIEGRDHSSERCPICLSLPISRPLTLVTCKHSFCDDCALHWFKISLACPICKKSISHFLKGDEKCLMIHRVQTGVESEETLTDEQIEKSVKVHRSICLGDSYFRRDSKKRKRKGSVKDELSPSIEEKKKRDDEEGIGEFQVLMPNEGRDHGTISSININGAYVEFQILIGGGGVEVDIQHVFVPVEFRGKGVAERMTRRAFAIAEKLNATVRPTCSYVRNTFLPRHHEEFSGFTRNESEQSSAQDGD